MPTYAILGVAKQKGGSVALSGHHNDRTRSVPNADPERTHLNRVLHGDDRNVRETVTEIIDGHGGKPRKDSVEAIEILCKASPAYFKEKDPVKRREKLDAFVEQAMLFLLDERRGGNSSKPSCTSTSAPPTSTRIRFQSTLKENSTPGTTRTGARRWRGCTIYMRNT